MSKLPWPRICASEEALALECGKFCTPATKATASPIDEYYAYARKVITVGTKDALEANEVLGRVLVLGLVSGVEQYFRATLAGVVMRCPVSRAFAADQLVAFGSVEYYPGDDLALGLFEGTSFSTKGELRNRMKRVLNVDVPDGSSIAAAIHQFDSVCHLRHAAAHSRGELSAGNARALALKGPRPQSVRLGLAELHAAAKACQNVVRAFNTHLFEELVERLATKKMLVGRWEDDRGLLEPLMRHFYSAEDMGTPLDGQVLYASASTSIAKVLGAPRQPALAGTSTVAEATPPT